MKRTLTAIVCAATLLSSTPGLLGIEAKAASIPSYSFQKPIDVKLAYGVGNVTQLSFTLNNSYNLLNNNTVLQAGSYQVSVSGSTLNLSQNGTFLFSGNTLSLSPTLYDKSHLLKIGSYNYLGDFNFSLESGYIRPYNTLELEDYLKGVVPYEMSNSWATEALKAQAVAARTFALGKGNSVIDDSPNNQVYYGYNANNTNSNAAVDQTSGVALTSNGSYIYAAYSSSNGGHTLSETNSWGVTSPSYLQYKVDPYDARSKAIGNTHFGWKVNLHQQQIDLANLDLTNPDVWWNTTVETDNSLKEFYSLKNYLAGKLGLNTSNFKIIDIPVLNFTSVANITNNDLLTGSITVDYLKKGDTQVTSYAINTSPGSKSNNRTYDFRTVLGDYYGPLQSPSVESVALSNGVYTVTGDGWGHGIGMSQWGAYEAAKEGLKYTDILSFYYPGATMTPYAPLVPVPDVVTNFHAAGSTDSTVSLAWDASNNATNYQVFRGDTLVYSGSALSFTDSSLTASSSYNYQIVAQNSKESSSPVSLTVATSAPSDVAPAVKILSPSYLYKNQYMIVYYKLDKPANVTLNVYQNGKVISTQNYGTKAAGWSNLFWSTKNYGIFSFTLTAKDSNDKTSQYSGKFFFAAPAKAVNTPVYYTVVKGDTLWKVSQKNKASVANIQKYNKMNSPVLKVGQKLIIGYRTTTVAKATATPVYKVISGDTLYKISIKFKVSVDTIKKLNNLSSNSLHVGQQLKI